MRMPKYDFMIQVTSPKWLVHGKHFRIKKRQCIMYETLRLWAISNCFNL